MHTGWTPGCIGCGCWPKGGSLWMFMPFFFFLKSNWVLFPVFLHYWWLENTTSTIPLLFCCWWNKWSQFRNYFEKGFASNSHKLAQITSFCNGDGRKYWWYHQQSKGCCCHQTGTTPVVMSSTFGDRTDKQGCNLSTSYRYQPFPVSANGINGFHGTNALSGRNAELETKWKQRE